MAGFCIIAYLIFKRLEKHQIQVWQDELSEIYAENEQRRQLNGVSPYKADTSVPTKAKEALLEVENLMPE